MKYIKHLTRSMPPLDKNLNCRNTKRQVYVVCYWPGSFEKDNESSLPEDAVNPYKTNKGQFDLQLNNHI